MNSPFQFGSLATDKNIIGRVKERAELKQMLSSGIHVTLISPSRWGKSSLVKRAMDELTSESVLKRYRLANPNTITRNKKVLQEKSFIEQENGILVVSNPMFMLWYKETFV